LCEKNILSFDGAFVDKRVWSTKELLWMKVLSPHEDFMPKKVSDLLKKIESYLFLPIFCKKLYFLKKICLIPKHLKQI
jgi:hypothetical protein